MRRRMMMVVMIELLPLAGAIVAFVRAWQQGVTAVELALFGGMYLYTMAGIEIGFHRLLAHRHFDAASPLRTVLLAGGSMAGEGSPLLWSALHRFHHAHSDSPDDLHSPVAGRPGLRSGLSRFLWAQFLWYTEVPAILRFDRLVNEHRRDLSALQQLPPSSQEVRFAQLIRDGLADPKLVWVSQRYPLWLLLGFLLPTALGFLLTGTAAGALGGLLWGGFVRHFVVKQVTFAINSVGHTVGVRSLHSADHSRNNVVMALLTLGSGWHNNHHAFPGAGDLQFRWWQFDPSAWFIRALARVGLASNLKPKPERAAIEARRAAAVPLSGAASSPSPGTP